MDAFEQFWVLYPRRDGENPKHPARLAFQSLIKKGIDPKVILDAVERFRTQMQIKRLVDTRFVPHARTWLNQHRFEGHAGPKSEPVKIGERMGDFVWDGGKWAKFSEWAST